ncbi:MAG: 4-alpha-glucanotransferase [Verrucomicrobiae bacterium]|nr:4-alpha-glucanotransferase [Verrucomicrobiae bacterium]
MKLDPNQKLAGVLCPVFSMRTEDDLGIGDTEAVRQMIDWCHKHGLSILQVLPINETSDDNSPYNAISSMALEPTTIATNPQHLPDLTPTRFRALAPPDLIEELRRGPVAYARVKKLKRDLLWAAFESFLRRHWEKQTKRAAEMRAFLREHADWVADYALFRVFMEDYHNWPTWDEWPRERQTPRQAWTWLLSLPSKERTEYEQRMLFHLYVQWIAYSQWTELKKYATQKKVYLLGDIPFGVNRYSADVWANRSIFDLEWSGGCPPEKVFRVDPFTEKWGQNWGIPLYKWSVLRERNYDWWRTRVGNVHRIFHLFRIDHVLGFFRIYTFPWQPRDNARFLPLSEQEAAKLTGGRLPHFQPYPDDTPEHCAFNRQQGEQLLQMVIEAAGDTAVVAEDLGVVPPYVPLALEKLGIPGYKIPHFLRAPDGTFVDGKTYPRLSLATPATHDHPPIRVMWRELWERADRGDEGAVWDLKCWMKYCGQDGQPPPREFDGFVHDMILRGVLESNSWLAVFQITDVFGGEGRFNTPGAVDAGNWSYRLDVTVRQLDRDPRFGPKIKRFAELVFKTGRSP